MGGKSAAIPLAAVDLAVPLVPFMRTPPMLGFMAFRIKAIFMYFWSTIAEKGKR
jgi:hypothetical protein